MNGSYNVLYCESTVQKIIFNEKKKKKNLASEKELSTNEIQQTCYDFYGMSQIYDNLTHCATTIVAQN